MRQITQNNVHLFCRTCLNRLEQASLTKCSEEKYNLRQTEDLEQWLETCTSLRVEPKDGLPMFLCSECYGKLRYFYGFRCMCIRSTRILSDLLQKPVETTSAGKQTNDAKERIVDIQNNEDWLNFDYNCETKIPIKIVDNSKVFIQETAHFNKSHNESVKETCNTLGETQFEEIFEEKFNVSACTKVEPITDELEAVSNNDVLSKIRETFNKKNTFENIALKEDEIEDKLDNSNDSYAPCTVKKQNKTKSPSTLKFRSTCKEKVKSLEPKKFEVKYRCDQCPRRFVSQENLDAHLRVHQGLKPFQCPQCERSFNKAHRMREHMRENHAEKAIEIVCSYEGCNKIFQKDTTYRVHYRTKHLNQPITLKTYICEDCGRTFKKITKFREHRYKHGPEENYPFQCEHCGKRFVSQRTYKDHLMRHSGIKNFECPHCDMKKTTKEELRVHINYHTKERQWQCPLCPSVFSNSANLTRHDRVVHKGIRQYACRYCDQSFGKPDTLKHHEMRHTGEKPHVCNVCQKAFIQSVALKAHMRTHNKDS